MKTNLRIYIIAFSACLLTAGFIHAHTVSGTVLNAVTGKPVQFVMVNFSNISREDSIFWIEPVYTGNDGKYNINLAEGNYFVFLSHEDYQSYEQKDIKVSSDLQLDFKLIPEVILPSYENSVSGTVKDKNTNLPVPYTAVSLIPVSIEPYSVSYSTDENGRFEMSNIIPGTYTLSVWQYGYESYNDSTRLVIEDKTKITGLNILLEPFIEYDNIKIKVFGILETGQRTAIPNAEVYLYSEYAKYYGITNENGEFLFNDAVGGSYEVLAYVIGYAQTTSKVEINSNNEVFEIKLDKLHLGTITGRVFADSDQKPLTGAAIYAYAVQSEFGAWFNYNAYTDNNGEYELELPKGEYIVACSYLNNYNFYYSVTEYFSNAKTMEEASAVIVGNDSTSGNINFGLDVTFPEIVQTKITGKIISANTGRLVNYAELLLNDLKNERYEYIKLEIDPDGNYSANTWMLKGQNELILAAISDGFEQQFYNGKDAWYDADILKADISDTNNTVDNINFTLVPYEDLANYSIQGQVTDQDQNPVQGVFAEAYGETGISGLSLSDSSGRYNIAGLPEGKYVIAFSSDGYLPQYYNNAAEWENAETVEVIGDVRGIDAVLSGTRKPGFAGIITGTVTYENNKPVAGARVILSTLENTPLAADITNSKGEFQLKGINEANYIITVSSVNYHSYTSSLNFNMKESNSQNYNINLSVTDVNDLFSNNKPEEYSLEPNFPNPFNPSTTIAYSLPEKEFVILKVFDLLGNDIVTLVSEEKDAGNYKIQFNAGTLSSGIYFYAIKAGTFTETKKLILMK